jgi:hypothetical protein
MLIDFGIAKLLYETNGNDVTLAITRTGRILMTPEYWRRSRFAARR